MVSKTVLDIKGLVKAAFINTATGERTPIIEKRNLHTYAAADIMARLVGGDTSYTPGFIGFIYGPSSGSAPSAISSRLQTWDGLSTELASVGCNINISALSRASQYEVDGSSDYYTGNGVILSAHSVSGAGGQYGFPTDGMTYAGVLADTDLIYHAMLLVRRTSGTNVTYIPFARVSLQSGVTYPAKPAGLELALDWQLSFF